MKIKRNGKGSKRSQKMTAAVVSTCILLFGLFAVFGNSETGQAEPGVSVETAAQDYSRFRHDSPQHTRMPCLVCHVRSDNSTKVSYPGHIPCASCHQQQFADNTNKICSICHTPTSVKPFPGLRSFNTRFDHSKHLRQTGCATCHKPSARGAALSMPSGRGHATCFTCHGPNSTSAGKQISSCSTCHSPGRPSRFSEASRAYRVNFSHSEHRVARMDCSQCHVVRRGSGTRQVSSPLVSMHFAPERASSCAACHNDKRAFGTADPAECKRCHTGATFKF